MANKGQMVAGAGRVKGGGGGGDVVIPRTLSIPISGESCVIVPGSEQTCVVVRQMERDTAI